MAKIVQVAFKEGDAWVDIEVPNFYDPEKHHNVRLTAGNKVSYAAMKMPDGNIYNKLTGKWYREYIAPTTPIHNVEITIDNYKDILENYGDGTVKELKAFNVLHCVPDLVTFMNECHRVLGHKCEMEVTVPTGLKAFDSPFAVRTFTPYTFGYFSKNFVIIQRSENDLLRVRFKK